ncbi:MATE efflux family protein [Lichtheimia hyalospora FSU 10163]|nr:MATE efflux family protein [Lichtheimia hyalospora FSU 10163]
MDQYYHSKDSSNSRQETSPLLGPDVNNVQPYTRWETFSWLFRKGLAISGTFILHQLLEVTNIAVIGHIGKEELAAATLGNMILNLGGYCLTVGSTTTLEKLCGQAWTGARDRTLVGIYLQRALAIMTASLACVAIVFAYSNPLLVAMGQDPKLSALAAVYLQYNFFGMAIYSAFDAYRKFLLAQGIVYGSMCILIAAVPVNAAVQYTFVFTLNLGLKGAPLGMALTYTVMLISLIMYSRVCCAAKLRQSWGGWSWKCFEDWNDYMRQASFNIMTYLCETAAGEAAVLAIAYHSVNGGSTAIGAQSVLARTYMASRMLGNGLSSAAATRVGHALGRGSAIDARETWIQGCWLSLLSSQPLTLLLICTRSYFGYFFTNDEQVVKLVARTLPILAFFMIFPTINGHCYGTLRGLGRQVISAVASFVSYYIIGVPIGLILIFSVHFSLSSVVSMWLGLGIASFLYAAIQMLFLCMVDWKAECRRVKRQLLENNKD